MPSVAEHSHPKTNLHQPPPHFSLTIAVIHPPSAVERRTPIFGRFGESLLAQYRGWWRWWEVYGKIRRLQYYNFVYFSSLKTIPNTYDWMVHYKILIYKELYKI